MIGRFGALLIAWVAGLGAANWPAADQDPAEGARKFTHAAHVDLVWRGGKEPEVWRDCRGCHDYSPARTVSAPQEHCDACHVPAGSRGVLDDRWAPGWEKDLAEYQTRTREAFRHHTHLMLECRECHLPPPGRAASDYDIVTGPGQCARCHDREAVAADDFAQIRGMRWFQGATQPDAGPNDLDMPTYAVPRADDRAALAKFADRLVAVFGGADGGLNVGPGALAPGGPFDHSDHGAMDCATCHENVPKARAGELGTASIESANCKQCHCDAKGEALQPAPVRNEVRVQHALGTFAHADHYRWLQPGQAPREGVANPAAYDALKAPGNASCAHCHRQDEAAKGNPLPDHPFLDAAGKPTGLGNNRYLDCVVCHDGAAWRTGETPARPLHDSTDGASDGKGANVAATGFAACDACHGANGADFFTVPQVAVERLRESVFLFGGQTHPYIGLDAKGQWPDLADCAKCHRGRVPELPSRLQKRPFRHAPHLSDPPTAADCLTCHPSAGRATTSAALAGPDFRTYEPAACGKCHLGSEVVEEGVKELLGRGRSLAVLAEKSVTVAFDHQGHVGKQIACAECHELDAVTGRDVVTLATARDCTKCHDHDRNAGLDTKGAEIVYGDEVASCARCHPGNPVAGNPAAGNPAAAASARADVPPRRGSPAAATDARFRSPYAGFGGFASAQFHPTDRRCTDCHKADLQPDPRWPGRRVPSAEHVTVAAKASPHDGQGAAKQPKECLRCHWSTPAKSGFSAGVTREEPGLDDMRKNPGGERARRMFGNRRKGYPGRPDADG